MIEKDDPNDNGVNGSGLGQEMYDAFERHRRRTFKELDKRRSLAQSDEIEALRALIRESGMPANLIRSKLSFKQAEWVINPHLMNDEIQGNVVSTGRDYRQHIVPPVNRPVIPASLKAQPSARSVACAFSECPAQKGGTHWHACDELTNQITDLIEASVNEK